MLSDRGGELIEKRVNGTQLVGAVSSQEAAFDVGERPKELPAAPVGEIRGLHQDAATIVGVAHAPREAGTLEATEGDAHASGGERHGAGEL